MRITSEHMIEKKRYDLELLQKGRSFGQNVSGSSASFDLTPRSATPAYTAPQGVGGCVISKIRIYYDNRAEKDLRGDLLGCECDPKIKASTCEREYCECKAGCGNAQSPASSENAFPPTILRTRTCEQSLLETDAFGIADQTAEDCHDRAGMKSGWRVDPKLSMPANG